MFQFMAQGHIIPFLALAFQLIKTNKYTITFVNTHKNINKLRSSLPPNSSFNLLEIPFNSSDHNLPPDTENTDSVPYNMAPNLIEATLSFKPHFRKLVSDLVSEENGQRKPLCIITDMFFGWCAEIAQEFGVFHAIFIGGGGFGEKSAAKFGQLVLFFCQLEAKLEQEKNLESPKMFVKLARFKTLQLSSVVRPPVGFDINSEFKADEYLPEGFEERNKISRQGLVVHNWAPQVDILSHKSVSAFLSHCGWNSVLEALSHGVPIIGWPMAAKQFYNVKLLEEKMGVCVEVARGKSCQVKHEEIVKIIELVMNETEKGMEMRRRACEIKEIIENAIKDEVNNKGSSTKAMDEFFNAVLTMRESKMG
ncbi:hypothetical protein JRO89_XS10G0032500 [Xanthoceras sorbifolium]|uniref:UDP-glycosyltransferases domain-containing protein n=1 Tax=Xanthoceras sorbifolium TaxID=99658 RepID=A0ABQ8HHE9_9ROSI|nr:hypothetical protein JRO89_XS10G0032500 [Xanthoceras sorbifolium]